MIEQSEMRQPVDIRVELNKLLSDVDQAAAITAAEMDAIRTHLDNLYAAAPDVPTQDAIMQTWNHVTSLAEQNSALAFQAVASGNMATTALEESKIAHEEAYRARAAYDDLEEALAEGDEYHPLLANFAQGIREDYQDWMEEEGWPEAMASAYEEIRLEVGARIATLADCRREAAEAFLKVIMGRRAHFTAEQSSLFAALLESLEAAAIREASNGTR